MIGYPNFDDHWNIDRATKVYPHAKMEIPRSPYDRTPAKVKSYSSASSGEPAPKPVEPVTQPKAEPVTQPKAEPARETLIDGLDLVKHLASYRRSLRAEIPAEAAAWYARAKDTSDPTKYRKVYDFLEAKMAEVKVAAQKCDEDGYRKSLTLHQKGFLTLLDWMLDEELFEYRNITTKDLLALLREPGRGWSWLTDRGAGWTWFKYNRYGFNLPMATGKRTVDVGFIPRYSIQQIHKWDGKCEAYFDAAEIPLAFPDGLDMPGARSEHLIRFKMENPRQKILQVTGEDPWEIAHLPVIDINNGPVVYDWSLPLFGAGE